VRFWSLLLAFSDPVAGKLAAVSTRAVRTLSQACVWKWNSATTLAIENIINVENVYV